MTCEYILKCESECLFVDREQSCPLWKHYMTEAKQKDINSRIKSPLREFVEGLAMAQAELYRGK